MLIMKNFFLIKDSEDIMRLLNRDNIKLEQVCNYHVYQIADILKKLAIMD